MKENKLEIDDIVYRWHGSFDSYLTRHKVVRLTAKRAILEDGTQCVNEVKKGWIQEELTAKIYGENYAHVILTSPSIENTYKEQQIRNKAARVFMDIRIKSITIEQCQTLIALFPLSEEIKP